MSSSILTNLGAMTALRTLQSTNRNLATTQDRVSTGMKVANAKDNAADWSIASKMGANASGYKVMVDQASVANAAIGLARKSAEGIVDLLETVKEKTIARSNYSAQKDQTSVDTVDKEIGELMNQIKQIAENSVFNGVNLVGSGGSTSNAYTFITNFTGGTYGVTGTNLTTFATAVSNVAQVDGYLKTAQDAAADFGASQQRVDAQQRFVESMYDALTAGVGALVDADMTEESARLQSLQVQQQLGAQAMQIANQAPQVLLGLFR